MAVQAAFFLSGAAALIYEVLFVRAFALAFGHTAVAAAAVTAAFMGGLAAGSFAGGRMADRMPPAMLARIFALLEAATAVMAAGAFFIAVGVSPRISSLSPLLWFCWAIAVLILPTALMGATLPVLTRRLAHAHHTLSAALGKLYAVNTIGAVCGTVFAGFYAIPLLGMRGTLATAIAANIAAALIAMRAPAPAAVAPPAPVGQHPTHALPRTTATAVLILTGTAAMLCEISWTRAFAMLLGSSTYAFSLMLAAFLAALAAGSAAASYARLRIPRGLSGLTLSLAATTLAVIGYLPLFNLLPFLFLKVFPLAAGSPALLHTAQFLLCASAMAVPVFLMGTILPLSCAVTPQGDHDSGRISGSLYAATAAGNIVGAVTAGLLLVPGMGPERTILVAAALYAAGTCLTSIVLPLPPGRIAAGLAGFLVICGGAAALRPAWDPQIQASGVFLYAPDYSRTASYRDFVKDLRRYHLLYHRDGVNSTVTVQQTSWGERFIRVNGKTDASTGSDMPTQVLQGYLPLLIHRDDPRTALVIGLGSGVTAGALASTPSLKNLDCVEIEPAMTSAARLFGRYNHLVLDDPRVAVIADDARHYLARTRKTYDIITSEPSNPWVSGVAQLFTKEAFDDARRRLAPGGIFCQWFHSYGMSQRDFRLVMNTFAAAFPHVLLMSTSHNDFFLLGSEQPWSIDYGTLRARFQENACLSGDLTLIGMNNPFALLATTFLLDDAAFRACAQGAGVHTDDRPTLEFTAPRSLYRGEQDAVFAFLLAAKKTMLPEGLTGLQTTPAEQARLFNAAGEAFLRAKDLTQAERMFSQALALDRRSPQTWTNIGRTRNLRDQHLPAKEAFRQAIALDPSYPLAWFHLGMLYITQGMEAEGLSCLETGLRKDPFDPMGSLQTALVRIKRGDKDIAARLLRRALSRPIGNLTLRRSLQYTLGIATQ